MFCLGCLLVALRPFWSLGRMCKFRTIHQIRWSVHLFYLIHDIELNLFLNSTVLAKYLDLHLAFDTRLTSSQSHSILNIPFQVIHFIRPSYICYAVRCLSYQGQLQSLLLSSCLKLLPFLLQVLCLSDLKRYQNTSRMILLLPKKERPLFYQPCDSKYATLTMMDPNHFSPRS